ncbi:MAG: DUF4395 domain-containing protein [Cyclobacteriaceae bacterium]|nr:DUF4395 domain-containing protein [Cyclobacteriaceae bacterium]MDH4295158.1 DUF4395 domain-containing protein [Cyclobacteriaceae bacterium]MDH5250352.1 DUF4395 domain-containing protein [Cyclobacteriaceae bacterium]
MKTKRNILTVTRLNRLRAQGYSCESNAQLSEMAFGIRFAYRSCVIVLLVATATQSTAVFSVMLGIAFLGIVLPNHPFDYVYNYALRHWMKKPKLPERSKQLKFACVIATTWLASIVYLMSTMHITVALLLAGTLTFVAVLTSTIDLCVPSLIYNALFSNKGVTPIKIQ